MAIITHTLKTGGTAKKPRHSYSVVWNAGGKQHWKRFPTREAAKAYQDEVRQQVRAGSWTPTKPKLFSAVIDGWYEHLEERLKMGRRMKRGTITVYRLIVEKHIRPTFGPVRSDRITPTLVAQWRATQADLIGTGKTAPESFNTRLLLLRAIIAWARKKAQRYMAADPTGEEERLEAPRKDREILEPEDVQALIQAAPAPDDTILRLAAWTGLRRGEVFGLQWHNVDFEAGVIHVRDNWTDGRLETPKSRSSVRTVDCPQRVLDDLKIHQLSYPPITGRLGTFVFRTPEGEPMNTDIFHERLKRLARGLGLVVSRLGLHTLRHGYASLVGDEEPLKYVADQLGHSSPKITGDIYQHVLRRRRTEAMVRLDARIERTNGRPNPLPNITSHDGHPLVPADAPELRTQTDETAPSEATRHHPSELR